MRRILRNSILNAANLFFFLMIRGQHIRKSTVGLTFESHTTSPSQFQQWITP